MLPDLSPRGAPKFKPGAVKRSSDKISFPLGIFDLFFIELGFCVMSMDKRFVDALASLDFKLGVSWSVSN